MFNSSSDVSAYNPIDRMVGGTMRFRRLHLNMTSAQVAKAANIEDSAYDDYETGRTRVKAGDLQRIAETLNVSIAYFFGQLVTRW